MDIAVITARDFNQSSSEVRQTANAGPVIITEYGKPAHVLMSYEHYKNIVGQCDNIADLLRLDEDVDIEIPVFRETGRSADLS